MDNEYRCPVWHKAHDAWLAARAKYDACPPGEQYDEAKQGFVAAVEWLNAVEYCNGECDHCC